MTLYHPAYRAQQAVLAAVIANSGGRYVAATHSAARNFRQLCYDLRTAIRKKNEHGTSPYDNIQFTLPKRGEPDDNVLTIHVLQDLPQGMLETLDGKPIPLVPTNATRAQPAPAAEPLEDLDLSDLFTDEPDQDG